MMNLTKQYFKQVSYRKSYVCYQCGHSRGIHSGKELKCYALGCKCVIIKETKQGDGGNSPQP